MPKSLAIGTVVRVQSAVSPGSMLPIGNIDNIPGLPSPTKPKIEHTDFDSTATEYFTGLPDFGELTFGGNLNLAGAGQAQMFADAQDPDAPPRDFEIDLPGQNYRFTFNGVVLSFSISAGGPNDVYKYQTTVQVNGSINAVSPIPS